ncbi:MAG: hypothetical protein WBA44_11250 [Mesorhizobium sp.]
MAPIRSLAAVTTLLIVVLGASAHAEVTSDEIGKRLQRIAANSGAQLTFDRIEGSGAAYRVVGAKASSQGVEGSVPIGDIALDGMTETNGGDYRVGRMSLASWKREDMGAVVSMSDLTLEGLTLAGEGSADPFAGIPIYDRGNIGKLTMAIDGKTLLTLTNTGSTTQRGPSGRDVTYEGRAERIAGDLTALEMPTVAAIAEPLGLTTFEGKMLSRGAWSLDTGKMSVETMEIDLDRQGRLAINMELGGLTQDFMQQMEKFTSTASAASGEQQQAAQIEGMKLLGQMTLAHAALRYDDASLAGRALDMLAAKQGAKRSDLPGLAQFTLPFLLSRYLPQEAVSQITGEVATFLADPKSLEIAVRPAEPLPVMALGMAYFSPKEVVGSLGLKVTANR